MEGASVRIAVVGDKGTGKTSLILAYLHQIFQTNPIHVYSEVQSFPSTELKNIFLELHDTSADERDEEKTLFEIEQANSIILTCETRRPKWVESLDKWLKKIKEHNQHAYVVVCCCKQDLEDGRGTSDHRIRSDDDAYKEWNAQFKRIIRRHKQVDTAFQCSATDLYLVCSVMRRASEVALYPVEPLYNSKKKQPRNEFLWALSYIFKVCDVDNDGILSNEEWEDWEAYVRDPSSGVMQALRGAITAGGAACFDDKNGVKMAGFHGAHLCMLTNGQIRQVWRILHMFGFYLRKGTLGFSNNFLGRTRVKSRPGASLSPAAVEFLTDFFHRRSHGGVICQSVLDDFIGRKDGIHDLMAHVCSVPHRNQHSLRAFSLPSFLSLWQCYACEHPRGCMACLARMGFQFHHKCISIASALITAKRRPHEQRRRGSPVPSRAIFKCALVGSEGVGKRSILQRFLECGESDHVMSTKAVGPISKGSDQYLIVRGQLNLLFSPCSSSCDLIS
eukprot:TRINITY_DN4911_c0_g1_i2.p1 TRINITY_DN4911_c0_g1~~TRINITY_DN4911_c0_g1_i2.p1  ORF type:complete len:533 (+),score=48.59 TRINITY_DN4911_c0_g1_i2:89-1600(+)